MAVKSTIRFRYFLSITFRYFFLSITVKVTLLYFYGNDNKFFSEKNSFSKKLYNLQLYVYIFFEKNCIVFISIDQLFISIDSIHHSMRKSIKITKKMNSLRNLIFLILYFMSNTSKENISRKLLIFS